MERAKQAAQATHPVSPPRGGGGCEGFGTERGDRCAHLGVAQRKDRDFGPVVKSSERELGCRVGRDTGKRVKRTPKRGV